ncbi:UDP-N-acetylglucosamine transporter ROCK1 isoform X5 [Henckelia pumila]|uniref:UDP-N-acetylglucosamine transporter ROCK1 isoform X5 n=1 Tax=Henckelia pumila TaxID=405737 RepID=UPI003C6E6861
MAVKKIDSAQAGAKVWLFSLLLTLQYGAQPLISKNFTSRQVIVTSSVLACEVVKVLCALILLAKDGTLRKLCKEWTLLGSLTASGLPAAIYALQNSLLQISYRNLDSLTFSMLNQTKMFFTALFTYIILRQKQSIQQIGALFLLIIAAVLLSIGEGSSKAARSSNPDEILFYGIVPVLVASVLSGLASALCQWASQCIQVSRWISYETTWILLWLDSIDNDTCCTQCCWWNSSRSCDNLCWRCSKGICHSFCASCHSSATIRL